MGEFAVVRGSLKILRGRLQRWHFTWGCSTALSCSSYCRSLCFSCATSRMIQYRRRTNPPTRWVILRVTMRLQRRLTPSWKKKKKKKRNKKGRKLAKKLRRLLRRKKGKNMKGKKWRKWFAKKLLRRLRSSKKKKAGLLEAENRDQFIFTTAAILGAKLVGKKLAIMAAKKVGKWAVKKGARWAAKQVAKRAYYRRRRRRRRWR